MRWLRPARACALLAVLVGAETLDAQRAPAITEAQRDSLTAFVERARRRLGLPGVAVSVATRDSVIFTAAAGRGTQDGAPILASTPFYIGSVTKTLTAVSAMQLVERGAIGLDAPIETTLSDFALAAPFEPRSITARHLLQHRSGIRQWSGHDANAQRTGATRHIAPRGPPDREGEYSSLNFMILGKMVAAASGESYASFLQSEIFAPLDMRDASVAGAQVLPTRGVQGHQSYFGVQVARDEPPPPPYLVPAGFVAASANDLGRFGGMLVGAGSFGGTRILAPETAAMLLGPLDTVGRALGFGRSRVRDELMLEHAGNARTSSARLRLVPNAGYAIAVLTNTNSGPFFSATEDVTDGIHAILAGESPPALWPKERLLKGAILIGTVLSVAQAYHRARAWDDAGRPTTIRSSSNVVAPLALDVGGGLFVLVALPRLLGVPLGTISEYFPDLGIALWTSAAAGITGGAFRAMERSSR